jgi:SNF2 family DNA or RNA helicase
VVLGDGSVGLLPEDWLSRWANVASMGEVDGEQVRFTRSQGALLDALLASEPEARFDERFDELRTKLRAFDGVRPARAPKGFRGELRDYQSFGLAWMRALGELGLGGCLADDMGLGKTVQVLALLAGRRRAERAGPSLVVAPKSVVFNWRDETARFAPSLRVLDHTGSARMAPGAHFADHDIVLTTYGTLRRDIAALREIAFDYAILDEAQTIKNASSASAKAARLLRARHRLALSGTPIENHLGELWSLFEFLNPGMLGAVTAFKRFAGSRSVDDASMTTLARAIRPFVLRRTKKEVAKELPDRIDQVVHCELERDQRGLYDELKAHYRASLLSRARREGVGRMTTHVLEALLRLRQAACHPGLIDPARANEPSAKLETLLAQLESVVAEGHKALVFSQFTSLLAIVRARIEAKGVAFEYLDGQTRDRAARVERFQRDDACRVFLVSLKAGGVGLNLTAAAYVFLLDPWWNPAVEAQAIDRAHRIGQQRTVFAYRLIATDTVEERVLDLQRQKRALVEGLFGADGRATGLRGMTAEDLEVLLS